MHISRSRKKKKKKKMSRRKKKRRRRRKRRKRKKRKNRKRRRKKKKKKHYQYLGVQCVSDMVVSAQAVVCSCPRGYNDGQFLSCIPVLWLQ